MKLGDKLRIGFAIPMVLLLGIGSYSIYSFHRIDQQVGTIYDDRVIPLKQLKEISDSYAVLVIDAVNKANSGIFAPSEALNSVNDAQRKIQENWRQYKSTQLTLKEQQLIREVDALFINADVEIDQLRQVLQANDPSELKKFDGPLYQVIDPLSAKIQELIELQLEVAQQERLKAASVYQESLWIFIFLLSAAVIMGSPIGFLVVKRAIIATLEETVNQIAASSAEIAAAAEEQERIVSQQATSVTQTTTAMDQLGASAKMTAEQATTIATATQKATLQSQAGAKVLEQNLGRMLQLQAKVKAIAQQISFLSEQTNQISNISALVSDLANQTNLLALNAAVEAVHAGEQGKGFAVVASEIRRLADQSKSSAEKINTLVIDIQAAIHSTVMVSDEGTKTVDEGIKTAQEMSAAFMNVADAAQYSATTTQQIALNAKQQSAAIQQVVDAMSSLNQAAKESVGGISQTKLGTQQLKEVALALKEKV